MSWVLQFAERDRSASSSGFPTSLRRMSVLRPAVVSDVTLWGLLALFVAGIPILALWAFARALRHDDA